MKNNNKKLRFLEALASCADVYVCMNTCAPRNGYATIREGIAE